MIIFKTNLFCVCTLTVCLIFVVPVHNAPRHKQNGHTVSSTNFDQKQSGDYNIQVRLKDFQIIAVLGDDTWGGYGDYDYNYDYSDLTIKPTFPLSTTPNSAVEPATNSSDTLIIELPKPEEATTKPPTGEVPNPEVLITDKTPTTEDGNPSISEKPIQEPSTPSEKPAVDESEKPLIVTVPSEKPTVVIGKPRPVQKPEFEGTAGVQNAASKKPSAITVDGPQLYEYQIPVIVGDQPYIDALLKPAKIRLNPTLVDSTTTENPIIKNQSPEEPQIPHEESAINQTNLSVVEIETSSLDNAGETEHQVPLGEILHYRKCAEGYTRNKQGRCRKIVRTPQLPFGITRLASNLASRFRHATTPEEH